MGLYKLSSSGTFKDSRVIYKSLLMGNPAVVFDQGSVYPIGISIVAAASNEINFTNIPQNYKHLQLRASVLGSSQNQDILMRVNGVSAANSYARHELRGTGTSPAIANGNANTTEFDIATNAIDANYPTSIILDILDYSNTNKNKTFKTISGGDRNGSGSVSFITALRMSTAAVTSIRIFVNVGNINVNSTFALYGISA